MDLNKEKRTGIFAECLFQAHHQPQHGFLSFLVTRNLMNLAEVRSATNKSWQQEQIAATVLQIQGTSYQREPVQLLAKWVLASAVAVFWIPDSSAVRVDGNSGLVFPKNVV
jgi:hypothetical protein